MHTLRSCCSLILIFLLYASLTIAQPDHYIGHIGSEDGLSSQLCTNIIEDDYGNLWISSFQDVQKYDGYAVKVLLPQNMSGEASESIIDLYKDKSGYIWIIRGKTLSKEKDLNENILYQDCHISIIDPLNESIIELNDHQGLENLNQEEIIDIFPFEEIIYFLLSTNEIYSYTDTLKLHTSLINSKNVLGINENGEIISYDKGNLIISTNNNEVIQQLDKSDLKKYAAILTSQKGQIFLLEEHPDDVVIFELNHDEILKLSKFEKNEYFGRYLMQSKINKYTNDRIIINGKLFSKNDESKYQVIPNPKLVNDYLISKTGLAYAATNLGIQVLSNKRKIIKNLATDDENKNSVRGIYVDENILAYKVYNHEKFVNKTTFHDLTFLDGIDLGYMAFMHYHDPVNKDHVWSVGHIPDRVRRIDFKNKKIKYFQFSTVQPSYTNSLIRSSVTSKLYLGSASGLYLFNNTTEIFEHIRLNCFENKTIVLNHLIEKENEIWIATSQGVVRYDERNNLSTLHPIIKDSISYSIQFIHEDDSNPHLVWLGTKRGGLAKWNTNTDSIQFYNTTNGLSNDDVHAIIEDNTERLWISTNRYLNCYDKKTSNIYIYTEQDGLNHSEFNRHSFFYDSLSHTIYFGGLNGYNYFQPDSISTTDIKNKINVRIIDAFKTQNDGVIENVTLETINLNTIDMLEKDISLQLNLSTNYLFDGDKTQYSYRIPGLIDKWNKQSSNELKLNRLPYGKHIIEIISDLNKPSIASNIFSLEINVIQPFKSTWTFLILSVLTFLYLTWLTVQRYNKNIKNRNLKLEKMIKLRTQELTESNNTKNKIFTILAHDLRNPISSLSNLTEKIKFLSKHKRIDELNILAEKTNSRINALDDNLRNILLWALSENKKLELNPRKLSLLHEINKILDIYSHPIEEKRIATQIELEDIDQVYLDVSVLQTILRCFITNAIKFSYHKGSIVFSKTLDSEEQLELKISDNGIGMELEEQQDENLQIRRIRTEGKGSGIGLLLAKDLSEKAGIKLRFDSQPNEGTSIYILMPKA